MIAKEHIERVLKELRFARCKPEDCGDNHADEYRMRIRMLEHTELHVDKAISILEELTKK